jgi:hypothetical protein
LKKKDYNYVITDSPPLSVIQQFEPKSPKKHCSEPQNNPESLGLKNIETKNWQDENYHYQDESCM